MNIRKVNSDIVAGLIMIAFGAFFLRETTKFPVPEAAIFPQVALILLILLSIPLVVKGIISTCQKDKETGRGFPLKEFAGPVIALIMASIYVVGMQTIGFFPSTAIFLPLAIILLGQRSVGIIITTTVGIELFIYFLFVTQLKVYIP